MTRSRTRLETVVAATDFSPGAAAALGRAAWLPLKAGAALSIVHVVPETLPPEVRGAAVARASARLQGVAAELARIARDHGVEATVDPTVLTGVPHVEIVRHARSMDADLVVLGRHGPHPLRDAFLGTTAERVVRKGDVPVLLVKEKAQGPYRRPVVASDLSDASRRVADLAIALLPRDTRGLRLVHAYHVAFDDWLGDAERAQYRREMEDHASAALSSLAAALAPRIACRATIREGDPRLVVLREAVRARADLVVAGTHARSGVGHALLGSVAEWLIRGAPCDVAVTRPARFTFEMP